MPTSLQRDVADVLRTHGVQRAACVIGVSGGLDSMTLLDCCARLSSEHAITPHVIHVNYGLRGAESDADEALVRDVCARYAIPLQVVTVAPYDEPRLAEFGLEAIARELRYAAFSAYAEEHAIPYVLTAHTLDDQAETVIMHLARGSGMHGLAGIPITRALSPTVRVVRPLLHASRNDVQEYAREHGVQWREDASNATDTFLRNRVRQLVVPALREAIGPHAPRGIARSADNIRTVADFIDGHVAAAMEDAVDHRGSTIIVDLEQLDRYHEAVVREVLRQALELTFDDLHRVMLLRTAEVGSSASINGRRFALRERNAIIVEHDNPPEHSPAVVIHDGGQYVADAQVLHVTHADVCDVTPHGGPATAVIDAASVRGSLVWRRWQHGDRFQPFGMTGHTLVSDLLTNARVPHHLRTTIRVVCDDEGIIWVCGLRQAERTRVTSTTTSVYNFHHEQLPQDA